MKIQASASTDNFDDPLITIEEDEETHDEDLWFLPGPLEEEPDDLPPGPRAEPPDTAVIEDWAKAEGAHTARLAKVAGRLGALDDRLLRGPEGWRHRLALIEAADLSWFAGDRVSPDRLALWISMRLSGVQDDSEALARAGWAVRRLTSGPEPMVDLASFLDRRDPEKFENNAERFEERAGSWLDVMTAAVDLHPITSACMGFHLWSLAGLGQYGDRIEAAVTAGRIAASDGNGAIFAPLAMGCVDLGIGCDNGPPFRAARHIAILPDQALNHQRSPQRLPSRSQSPEISSGVPTLDALASRKSAQTGAISPPSSDRMRWHSL